MNQVRFHFLAGIAVSQLAARIPPIWPVGHTFPQRWAFSLRWRYNAAMQFRLKDLFAIQLVLAIGIGMLVFAFRAAAVSHHQGPF